MASHLPDTAARALDHFVLPVADLATARARLTALGFTVAPDGVHPFGTANCCIYLADSTFLEPLAVADRVKADAATRDGNVFIARDVGYRSSVGENGFSAVVLRSEDAAADHDRFVAAGVSAGRMLEFSRAFIDAGGRQDTASFRLAFAADAAAPDVFFFAVERLKTPNVDRSVLEAHVNGVKRVGTVLLAAERPDAHADILATVIGGSVQSGSGEAVAIAAANATLVVLMPAALGRDFGLQVQHRPLRAVGLVFGTADLAATESVLRNGRIEFHRHNGRLIVPPAAGQGAAFIFEALQ